MVVVAPQCGVFLRRRRSSLVIGAASISRHAPAYRNGCATEEPASLETLRKSFRLLRLAAPA
jgi:hypothetical protein